MNGLWGAHNYAILASHGAALLPAKILDSDTGRHCSQFEVNPGNMFATWHTDHLDVGLFAGINNLRGQRLEILALGYFTSYESVESTKKTQVRLTVGSFFENSFLSRRT
jgi:hypothetical protein